MSINTSMLEIAVNAAAGRHDLTGFIPVTDSDQIPNGYQARCRKCHRTAWVGGQGLIYNLLDSICPGGFK